MPASNRKYAASVVDPNNLNPTRFRRFCRDYFGTQPILSAAVGYGAAPTLTTGAVNLMTTPQQAYEWVVLGGGQTLAPVWGANGLEIGLDATDNEGIEITNGVTARSPAAFTVGVDRAFYCKTTVSQADVSVNDTFYFGFRKVQAYAVLPTTYTDYACLGINASAAAGAIKIMSDNDDAGESETDTTMTWADGAEKTFEVRVYENRYARFLVNGAYPTVTNTAFQFDASDVVIPFLYLLRGATAANAIYLRLWEYGFLPRRGE